MTKSARVSLSELYLDYKNNFISVEKFAEHHGLHLGHAIQLVSLAKAIFLSKHPDA